MSLRHGSPAAAGLLPERIELARRRCAAWVKSGHTPSLSVCVARGGVIALDEAFGQLGPEDGAAALATDSLFPVASITKAITSTLVMQLVEDGVLALNRPALEYLPELAAGTANHTILVHHLLTHTSGYPWHTDPVFLHHAAAKLAAGFELPECPENQHPEVHKLLHLYWDVPRPERTGRIMTYSNHNFVLLGEILRRLTGRSIEELAREQLFDPAGMNDSYYVVPESEAHRVVQRPPHAPFGAQTDFFPALGSRVVQVNPNAGSGVFTTPRDIVTFGQIFLDRGRVGDARILSPASVEAMTRDQIPGLRARIMDNESEHASWGYGFAIESPIKWPYFRGSLIRPGSFTHPGAGGATFWVDPEREVVGAYFEVCMRITDNWEFRWNFDLFENLITSAVA